MNKVRIGLSLLAIIAGVGLAFADARPELLMSANIRAKLAQWPCTASSLGCEHNRQYIYKNGEFVQISGYGSYYVCMYAPAYTCTWDYRFCPNEGNFQFVPCQKGNICYVTPYGCAPDAPIADSNAVVIKPTREQKAKVDAYLAALKEEEERK